MKVFVIELKQDDPAKCTAARLVKFRLIYSTRKIPKRTIVLNPLSEIIITKNDSSLYRSLCAIDCSWNRFNEIIPKLSFISRHASRRLPLLLAGNPVNYAKLGKLSTAEAIAGSLFILGYEEQANEIMNKFKWGHTFLDLNIEILNLYHEQENQDGILRIEKDYFPNLYR